MDEVGIGTAGAGPIRVQVARLGAGREIAWGDGLTERLEDRVRDVHEAITRGIRVIADGLPRVSAPTGWEVGEVTASFGVTLTAEAGVVLSKASTEATFDISVTVRRTADSARDGRAVAGGQQAGPGPERAPG